MGVGVGFGGWLAQVGADWLGVARRGCAEREVTAEIIAKFRPGFTFGASEVTDRLRIED